MAWLGKCLTALYVVMCGVSAAAAAPAGSAVSVDPEAGIGGNGTLATLVVGQDVFLGDRVQTSSGGRVEIKFQDGTKLVVGPRSALVIEDYLLRADGSAGDFAINALSGTFRFVSGSAAKERYKISTPTGTMGIRGTEFDFAVDGRRSTQVLMYLGATELCSTAGVCNVFADTCELGEMTPTSSTSLGLTDEMPRAERGRLRKLFPYGTSQQLLDGDFRLPDAAKCLGGSLSARAAAAVAEKGVGPASTNNPGGPGAPAGSPPPASPPPPEDDGGDCAGNSDNNPGNSQNCSK